MFVLIKKYQDVEESNIEKFNLFHKNSEHERHPVVR
jgi:hypothetical protein